MTDHPIGVEVAVELPGIPEPPRLREWAAAALEAADAQGALAIRIVDEAESAALNARWRNRQGPTNVLSFPAPALPAGVPVRTLGDIAICAPVVAREATVQDKAPDAHWAHMVTHGVLHLAGYDHEHAPGAAKMEALETEILARLGYPDPYLDE